MKFHFFSFRKHCHGGRRRVNTPSCFGGGNSLHPVYSAFELEARVGTFSFNHKDDLFKATKFRSVSTQDVDLPTLFFSIARIHSKKRTSKEGGFVAARPGPDLNNDVLLIIGVFRQ